MMVTQAIDTRMKKLTFFQDPAVDTLMGVVMALAAEVYVLKDRVRVMEQLLAERDVLSGEQIESFAPTPEQEERFRRDRDQFFERLLRPIAELEE
jgi:hypothetical protein